MLASLQSYWPEESETVQNDHSSCRVRESAGETGKKSQSHRGRGPDTVYKFCQIWMGCPLNWKQLRCLSRE